jgi:hypothetical protein
MRGPIKDGFRRAVKAGECRRGRIGTVRGPSQAKGRFVARWAPLRTSSGAWIERKGHPQCRIADRKDPVRRKGGPNATLIGPTDLGMSTTNLCQLICTSYGRIVVGTSDAVVKARTDCWCQRRQLANRSCRGRGIVDVCEPQNSNRTERAIETHPAVRIPAFLNHAHKERNIWGFTSTKSRDET